MLSVKKYQEAIENLSQKRKENLLKLYRNGPFEDSNLIATVLGYKGFTAANLHIGNIGKYISEVSGVPSDFQYEYKGELRSGYFQFVHTYTAYGWDLVPNLQKAIEKLGWSLELLNDGKDRLPTEVVVVTRTLVREGKLTQVLVNSYERDSSIRRKAERIHGRTCIGCSINFSEVYGSDIKEIIHYHHTRPLSEVKIEEEKDIVKDVVPLCPNCHSVVHSTMKLMTIKELQKRVEKAKKDR
jgi:predicted HNH restriction endonuclease